MTAPGRRTVRLAMLAVLVVGAALLANGYAAADPGDGDVTASAAGVGPTAESPPGPNASDAVGPRDDVTVTVVTTQRPTYAREHGSIVAFRGSGEVLYRNDSYQSYFDVDPVEGTRYTVEYVAARELDGPACSGFATGDCTRSVVERVNLTTGAVERVWANETPGVGGSRYHDVDRINETHLVVADLHRDRVFAVDARADAVTWEWRAEAVYSRDDGGRGDDWTHVNDVEVLADGRIVVSVRNMDQVLFLRPGEGVVGDWTLGTVDDHRPLHEQHNPDYIPPERGGPAVLVADSENDRVVEYRREDGGWTPVWQYSDVDLHWPRDADRLPDGNTLVVDSGGDEVLEVTPDGRVVWRRPVATPYDAERLGTDDESDGPATSVNRAAGGGGPVPGARAATPPVQVLLFVRRVVPGPVVNGLLFVAPPWVGFTELVVLSGVVLDLGAWGGLELYWSRTTVRSRLRGLLAPATDLLR